MKSKLFIIWDFDAAIGQINSTYPYNYHEELIYKEISNVEGILKKAKKYDIQMIFAITGFSAEAGVFPFHIQELIRNIHQDGHEIASHSWKHEWLPFLEKKQLTKTLHRSKLALEKCIGHENIVNGFVPPFSRPMSWLKKGAISFGDRALGPFFKVNDMGKIIKEVSINKYSWIRVSYVPLYEKFFFKNGNKDLSRKWFYENQVLCVPNNYVGFDQGAESLIKLGIEKETDIVISGHPSGLSRPGKESVENFDSFLKFILKKRDEKLLKIDLLKNHI